EQGYHFRDHTLIHYDGKRMRVPLLMDLNRDGWLDIAGQVKDGWVRFWWGSENGFDETQITDLDLERDDHLMYLKAADFNKDGWLDLFLPKRGSPDGRKETSMLYYGSPDGFNNDNRIIIDAFVPYQNTISDVDQDGWLDLFLTSYGGEVSGNRPSLLYYGQEGGFKEKRDEFKTFGSSGSEIMDYDRDGYKDILISNHRRAGTTQFAIPHEHIVPQMLYWGGREGFSKENRWEMVEVGTSGLNPRDLGNSYDRELYEDYTSSVHELESEQTVSKINWEAEIQHGTKVTLQLRAAGTIEKLAATEWTGAKGLNTWFTKSGDVKGVSGKYVQYRARLSTPDGAGTPYLTSVRVTY
ncbi:MAG: VCBS repeat-containing protein, partial [Candidatus Marinimicrobia bacterium]|nr:VCBS repeat-containing protein [Candidatus Neomarinimicrobiota bacterium]